MNRAQRIEVYAAATFHAADGYLTLRNGGREGAHRRGRAAEQPHSGRPHCTADGSAVKNELTDFAGLVRAAVSPLAAIRGERPAPTKSCMNPKL